jgi:hypothetical protein
MAAVCGHAIAQAPQLAYAPQPDQVGTEVTTVPEEGQSVAQGSCLVFGIPIFPSGQIDTARYQPLTSLTVFTP